MIAPEGSFWIGSDHPFDLQECYLDFCTDVDLATAPASAKLCLTADSRYRLWINGQFVGRGPERSWPSAMAVDEQPIAAFLRQGHNRIHVQVYSPGYSHFAHVHRNACGLICWLQIDGKTVLTSDRTWRVRRDLSWSPLVPRVSIYGSGVEMRDLSQAVDADADDLGTWAPARIVQPPSGPIWASLRPRHTPLLSEDLRHLTAPFETRFGVLPAGLPGPADPHHRLRAIFDAVPQAPVPDRIPPGHAAIWVFDLGESRVSVAGATLSATAGDSLMISYAEGLRGGRLLLSDPATYCRMRPTDRTRLREGRQEVEGFTLRGGRYLIFLLETGGAAVPDPHFHARLPAYPLALRDQSREDDPALAAVQALCQRTTLACLQDGFVDSVWRESSQWLGDVVAQSFALAALSDDVRPLRMAIDLAAAGGAEDGVLPSVLPGDVPAYVVTDYNFSWVELLDFWSRHPGRDDEKLVERHWPTLCRMLDRFDHDRAADGLIRSQRGRRLFLDWSPMDRSEPNLTYNLRYLHALNLAMGLGAALDAPETAILSDRAARLAADIRASLLHPTGWRESPQGAPASQLALSLLILTGLVPPVEAEALADTIVARSLDPDDTAPPGKLVLASPFMHHYVFKALHALCRATAIREIIAVRWGRWARAGVATTWENWSIDFPDGSACHGFSAHPLGWLNQESSADR